MHAVESLGMDMTAEKSAANPQRRSAQSLRVKKAQKKVKRAVRLMRQVGPAINRVVKQNIPATVTYGASVVGCNNANLSATKRAMRKRWGHMWMANA